VSDLALMLGRLDALLARALAAAPQVLGSDAGDDRFRGLYVGRQEAERLLGRAPGEPLFAAALSPQPDAGGGTGARLAWLAAHFGLTPFDLDLILLALAPEADLRYERLYAYLQDHVGRRRPGVDLALNLLCATADEKIARRAHFTPEAPLIRHGLLHLVPDPELEQPPLLAHALKLDEQATNMLLGLIQIDPRLAPFTSLVDPAAVAAPAGLPEAQQERLCALARRAAGDTRSLQLYFQGPCGCGQLESAAAVARALGGPLLRVDLRGALARAGDTAQLFRLIFREAWFHDALLYLEGLDQVIGEPPTPALPRLAAVLAADRGITILSGSLPWRPCALSPTAVLTVAFPPDDAGLRLAQWRAALAQQGAAVKAADLSDLAGRFHLGWSQIVTAAAGAAVAAQLRGVEQRRVPRGPTREELFAAAREQSGRALDAMARKVRPCATWDELVLPADALAQLREMCRWVAHRQRVLGAWGFGRRLSRGIGASALFAGPSGTGKTMAAEVIAGEIGLDLYAIDLAGVVSKYIGETEKNLDRVFAAADGANAVLFFDEADALFGKRSEVRDSHDRYANIEISYLLQKMEDYPGLTILATNLRQHLDEAFVRRLAFAVTFPFPDPEQRLRIWSGIWPAETPLAADLDLSHLARHFKLSGGNIKNIALAAAYGAAADGGVVTRDHLLHAIRREYQKLGKALSPADLLVAQGAEL
jgi:hypothetical protein